MRSLPVLFTVALASTLSTQGAPPKRPRLARDADTNDAQALRGVRRHAEAEVQFAEAVRLEPYWAAVRFDLAATLEAQGKVQEAGAQYETYLARCPWRLEDQAKQARRRLGRIHAGGTP